VKQSTFVKNDHFLQKWTASPEGSGVKRDILDDDQKGAGIGDSSGLWNDEIEQLMRKHSKQGFKGVYSLDEIQNIPFNTNDKKISFIMNTQPSYVKMGHWVSIFITPTTLEYYDPFGEEPPKKFLKVILPKLKMWMPNNLFQFKINRIKFQRNNSNNCGYFAMQFLTNRYKGIPFKEVTGFTKFDQSLRGEKIIKEFKRKCKQFGFI